MYKKIQKKYQCWHIPRFEKKQLALLAQKNSRIIIKHSGLRKVKSCLFPLL